MRDHFSCAITSVVLLGICTVSDLLSSGDSGRHLLRLTTISTFVVVTVAVGGAFAAEINSLPESATYSSGGGLL